ncbi:unnamed protein product [Adineta steineri]|uniref:Uncharacterized protein n=1 Tax=Adineta steineri TaxID=433720 RepID=A0A819CPV3_9BILA|nr:unnamed protein product [Adineta steineri]CAF3823684.1 unnamed protein product [Adineta steineri]CAF3952185.1 unnamed protein product [Adineta steineri]
MSSTNETKDSSINNKGSIEGKQSPSDGVDADSKKSDTQNVPKSTGHEDTGVEKLISSGGSGGIQVRDGQGYEHYAQH